MGIPALFRWISQKYPKITSRVVEEHGVEIGGTFVPVDTSRPNPNGVEFDNLYLDMNGIIHPCCHPEDKPAPETEDEMFVEIFKYIDRIMGMIRPRKVLYMAIDGVAPRAKMNQQRSRRFRAAQDAMLKKEEQARMRAELEAQGHVFEDKEEKKHFDSNCITPGTPFMTNLATALRYYISDRLTNDPGWKDLKVILSDASVPGEGEHKIMDYIRRQREQNGYDPNMKHVLYGLDADLIMLALATHEPHFKILREDVFYKQGSDQGCFICGQQGHMAAECTGKAKQKQGEFDEKGPQAAQPKPFVFLHVDILREYLEVELKPYLNDLDFKWDLERAIDDWVLLVFFVGNDFLPHLPSLEIREGAIDLLVEIYKRNLSSLGGYLTDSGDLNLERVEVILQDLGKMEDAIFRRRREQEERRKENNRRRKMEQQGLSEEKKFERDRFDPLQHLVAVGKEESKSNPKKRKTREDDTVNGDRANGESSDDIHSKKPIRNREPEDKNGQEKSPSKRKKRKNEGSVEGEISLDMDMLSADEEDVLVTKAKETDTDRSVKLQDAEGSQVVEPKIDQIDDKEEAKNKAIETADEEIVDKQGEGKADSVEKESSEEAEEPESTEDEAALDDPSIVEEMDVTEVPPEELKPVVADDEEPPDDVRLWEDGWKTRYYSTKFGVDESDVSFRKKVARAYVEGFCWVLKYYYQGCQSWTWYYPYHYSPFASDFDEIGSLDIKLEPGTPFNPLEQLMGVLPAASSAHIPPAWRHLMENADSEIIEYYPVDFPVDLNGKKYAWQGVALLPFIDEQRLLDALKPYYDKLTEEEKARNARGTDIVYVDQKSEFFDDLCRLYISKDSSNSKSKENVMRIDPKKSKGLYGKVKKDPNVVLPSSKFPSPIPLDSCPDLEDNGSISAAYFNPEFGPHYKFKARLHPKVTMPPRVLDKNDAYAVKHGSLDNQGRRRTRTEHVHRLIRNYLGDTPRSRDRGGRYDDYNDDYGYRAKHDRDYDRGYNNRYDQNRSRSPYERGSDRSGYYRDNSRQQSGGRQHGHGWTPAMASQSFYSNTSSSYASYPSNSSYPQYAQYQGQSQYYQQAQYHYPYPYSAPAAASGAQTYAPQPQPQAALPTGPEGQVNMTNLMNTLGQLTQSNAGQTAQGYAYPGYNAYGYSYPPQAGYGYNYPQAPATHSSQMQPQPQSQQQQQSTQQSATNNVPYWMKKK